MLELTSFILQIEKKKQELVIAIADKEKFATTSNMTLMNNRMKNLQSSLTAMQNELASVQDIQSDIQMMVKHIELLVSQKDLKISNVYQFVLVEI